MRLMTQPGPGRPWHRRLRDRRAAVSVEFALVSILILLPLLAGGADFVELISAQSQLDASLQSLYALAWNSPATATNSTQISGVLGMINAHALPQVTLAAANETTQTVTQGNAQVSQVFVTYNLQAQVNLPVPLPFGLTNPFPLAASGSVEIQ